MSYTSNNILELLHSDDNIRIIEYLKEKNILLSKAGTCRTCGLDELV